MITEQDVRDSARRIVQQLPDNYCYRTAATAAHAESPDPCVYQRDGEPVCLVGHIYHDLGVPLTRSLETMSPLDHQRYPRIAMTEGAADLLNIMQDQQDNDIDKPWRTIVNEALA